MFWIKLKLLVFIEELNVLTRDLRPKHAVIYWHNACYSLCSRPPATPLAIDEEMHAIEQKVRAAEHPSK
jgi:hypothetical protein